MTKRNHRIDWRTWQNHDGIWFQLLLNESLVYVYGKQTNYMYIIGFHAYFLFAQKLGPIIIIIPRLTTHTYKMSEMKQGNHIPKTFIKINSIHWLIFSLILLTFLLCFWEISLRGNNTQCNMILNQKDWLNLKRYPIIKQVAVE